jgi:high-affinity Fe2+/Pb2+ permease
MMGHK